LALVLVASPALAGGPLANCFSGQPYLWPGGGVNIPFNPDQGDLGPLTNAGAVALTQSAFDQWGAVPSASVSYANAGQLPVDVDITNFGPYLNPVAPDGLSAIVFDDTGEIFDLLFGPGSGVLGFAGPEWANTITCEILEGVSFLNGPSFTDPTAAFDVMVHEFGHYTNLAHTVVNGQAIGFGDTTGPTPFDTFGPAPGPFTDVIETMYPFYFGPGSGTSTLHPDDVAILSTLYPAAGFFSSTGTIAGTIYAPNGSTRVTGVNVIARNVAAPFTDAVSAISSDFTDSTSQADPVVGTYTMNGLTPGATYAVFVDQILAGGFSTPPLGPLPGPEEFWNGVDESSNGATDDPSVYTGITAVAGSPAAGTDVIFNAPPPGQIDLGDDDTEELFLPFEFTLCGQSFNSVWVNSNGSLTFGGGDTDFSESASEFLAELPRVAMLWDDLNPSQGGTVSFSSTQNTFTVRFEDVPEFFSTGANTFEATLDRSSNHIDVEYGAISATDGLAGVSCGGAVASGFEPEIELVTVPNSRNINLNSTTAAYEVFSSGDNDLDFYSITYVNEDSFEDVYEPNDTLGTAAPITLPFDTVPVSRFTAIDPVGGDVDFFRFSAEAGTTLIAEVVAGSLDSVLGVFDANGVQVDLDDDGGSGLLSRIVYPVPADGDYFLGVTTFPDFGFTGAGGSGGRYVLDMFTIQGTLLDLGDDDSEEVTLGFSFPFQGQSWTSVWVNSNGNLTFGSGDTDFSESVFDLLNDQPRIAALWDDLNPSAGGLVLAEQDATSATISFVGVPEFFATGANTFAVTLDASGEVSITYAGVSSTDSIVGVTEGGGAADPGETDLSAAPLQSVVGTTYEQFGFGDPFDLDGVTVTFQP
jgi:hypothetical protein